MAAILKVGNGSDGDITISSNKNINTDLITGGRSYADGVNFRVNALGSNYTTVASTPNGLAAGDQVILINLMGRTSNWDNSGNYEIFTIDYISSNDVYFTQPVNKFYGDNGGNGNIALHPVMIQRVPNYNNLGIDSGATLTCSDCADGDNVLNGLVIFKCKGTFNLINGYINVNYKGYGGSAGSVAYGYGYGKGGGSHSSQNGGGGGGYGTQGLGVGNNYSYGVADLTKLNVGSGGGSGHYTSWPYNFFGGDGGGAVFIIATTITISTGTITSNGANGNGGDPSGGGGGSGGAVLLHSYTATVPNNSLYVTKGLDGSVIYPGNGGDGRIAVYYNAGSVGTMAVAPYTDTIELPYKISGTIAGGPAQYLRIYDIDSGELLNTYSGIANGAYEVDAPGDGPYDIMARKSNGKILSYGEVTPVEI
jgi:hypothetical protein